jgi:hypothetical protein
VRAIGHPHPPTLHAPYAGRVRFFHDDKNGGDGGDDDDDDEDDDDDDDDDDAFPVMQIPSVWYPLVLYALFSLFTGPRLDWAC